MTQAVSDTSQDCPLCGGEYAQRFIMGDPLTASQGRFSILRCPQCGLHSLSPRPSPAELLGSYPLDYQPFRPLSDRRPNLWQRRMHHRHWQLRCRAVHRFRDGGTLLDVGCGTGEFLETLRQSGDWQVAGVEPNEQAASYARQSLGLDVHLGDLSTFDPHPLAFDVVTMWEVLEHLPDPFGALQTIARLLKPSGVLLLSTPNAQALQARLWGVWWCGWDAPRHLYLFTRPTLERLLVRAGFRITRRLRFPTERYYLVESWVRRLASSLSNDLLRRWSVRLTAVVGLILWPALRLLDSTALSSQIAVASMPVSSPLPEQPDPAGGSEE